MIPKNTCKGKVGHTLYFYYNLRIYDMARLVFLVLSMLTLDIRFRTYSRCCFWDESTGLISSRPFSDEHVSEL